MQEQMERFRRQVAKHFGGPPGKGARYSAELRAEALALAQAAVERGESLRSIAAGLGIMEPSAGEPSVAIRVLTGILRRICRGSVETVPACGDRMWCQEVHHGPDDHHR